MRRKHPRLAFVTAAALALGACSRHAAPDDDTTGSAAAVEPGAQALPDVLDDADGLQIVAESLKETGIAGIFKGRGSYTLLAPEDAAFAQLGDAGKELTGSTDHTALAALLRDHLIPGYMTPQDISAAIDASKDRQVLMTTVSGRKLTFAKSDGTVTITAPDGSQANIDGGALAGGSSVAIPVNAVLKKI
ncbi:MAG TPA: fasciclin domain-containing protein [Novosphingobium sp.]|nr:fasciclin domain-containing protein [Novosphingobium sp.]